MLMVKANLSMLMVIYMKDSGLMTRPRAWVRTRMLMVHTTRVSGSTTSVTVAGNALNNLRLAALARGDSDAAEVVALRQHAVKLLLHLHQVFATEALAVGARGQALCT